MLSVKFVRCRALVARRQNDCGTTHRWVSSGAHQNDSLLLKMTKLIHLLPSNEIVLTPTALQSNITTERTSKLFPTLPGDEGIGSAPKKAIASQNKIFFPVHKYNNLSKIMNSVLMSRGRTIFVVWFLRLSLRYCMKNKDLSGIVLFFA